MARLDWRWGTVEPWPAWGGGLTGERLEEFQRCWEAVIAKWSWRWGKGVKGWWFDGSTFRMRCTVVRRLRTFTLFRSSQGGQSWQPVSF